MAQEPQGQHTLPGPVTISGAYLPTPAPPSILMQSLSASGTASNSTSTEDQLRKDKPWKYEGYDAFSKWMASEDDFFVFRRFQSLNASTILHLQHRISGLENRLREIHETVEKSTEAKWKNSSLDWDAKHFPERSRMMDELSGLLLHYNQYIEAFSKIRARPRAEQRQILNVVNWLKRGAVTKTGTRFIEHESDLISINSRSRPPLGQWLEACQNLHMWKPFKAKHVKGLHIESKATMYSSDEAFEQLTTLGVIFLGLIMLLAPMWWLECVSDSKARLRIITGFVVVFILAMTTATINKAFEVVAATAAYAAVLMVFMQIDGKSG